MIYWDLDLLYHVGNVKTELGSFRKIRPVNGENGMFVESLGSGTDPGTFTYLQ